MAVTMRDIEVARGVEAELARRRAEWWRKFDVVIGFIAAVAGLCVAMGCVIWIVRVAVAACVVLVG